MPEQKKIGVGQDTEITLGTGKLLGIFFLLVAICGAFFTMGYLFGRGSVSSSASTTVVSAVPSANTNTGSKPSAGGNKGPDTAQNVPVIAVPDSSNPPAINGQAPVTPQPALTPVKATDDNPANPPAEVKNAATGSFMVQVAAVSKQEDADILVSALRKKQYPVFVVANVPGDSLFHVQVGPFSDRKEADAMKSRLAGDGYNAIVK